MKVTVKISKRNDGMINYLIMVFYFFFQFSNISHYLLTKTLVKAFAKNVLDKTSRRLHDPSFYLLTINHPDSQSFSNSVSKKSQIPSMLDFNITANMPNLLQLNH